MSTPTVYLVDDDESFRVAMARLLRASGVEVKAFASAQDFLASGLDDSTGCLLLDLEMPEMSGLELQAMLARTGRGMPVIFLSGHGDIPSTVRAMRGGAEDFLTKRAPQEEVLAAVRRAFERDIAQRKANAERQALRARFDQLSEREYEVLGLVLTGAPNKQIAADLSIHERTVKLHRTSITRKLHVQSVAELANLAHAAGVQFAQLPDLP